jgi:hypothetical protein
MEYREGFSTARSNGTQIPTQFRYISRTFEPEDVIVGMDLPADWGKWTDSVRNKHKEKFMREIYGRDIFVFRDPDQLHFGQAGTGQINIRKIDAWFEVQDVTGASEKYDESISRIKSATDHAAELADLRPQMAEVMPNGAFWDPSRELDVSTMDWNGRRRGRAEKLLDRAREVGDGNTNFGILFSLFQNNLRSS